MWCESWLHHWLWVHDSLLDWLCRRRWIMDWLMDLWVNLRYWSRRRMGLGANIRMRVGANGWWICCLSICCFWSTELTMSWNFLSNNFNKQSTLSGERRFSSRHERGTKKKIWVTMWNRTSGLRIPRSNALPLSLFLVWEKDWVCPHFTLENTHCRLKDYLCASEVVRILIKL